MFYLNGRSQEEGLTSNLLVIKGSSPLINKLGIFFKDSASLLSVGVKR